jgi:hypothetical protein
MSSCNNFGYTSHTFDTTKIHDLCTMKRIIIASLLLVALACSKDKDPAFTSAEGKWKYTTPDGKIAVTFELAKTSTGGLMISSQTIQVDGVAFESANQIDGVSLPTIATIRINANDSKAIYPYNIIFKNGVVNSDFTKIEVPDATYTFPWPTVKALKTVVVERQ